MDYYRDSFRDSPGAPSRIPHGIFPGISPRIFSGVFQILDSPREYCLFSKLLRKISPGCSSIFVSVIIQKIYHLHQELLWKKSSKGFISCLKCSCIYHMQIRQHFSSKSVIIQVSVWPYGNLVLVDGDQQSRKVFKTTIPVRIMLVFLE